jgi:predicted MPP superfamily phosphohydrolase
MFPPFLWLRSVEGLIVMLLFGAVFTRLTMKDLARKRALQVGWALSAIFLFATHLAWEFGPIFPVRYWGAYLSSYGMLVLGFFVASLPLAWLLRALTKRALRAKLPEAPSEENPKHDLEHDQRHEMTRRQVLGAVTAVAPAIAVGACFKGISNGTQMAEVPRIIVRSASVPAEFDGLSILQLSDLHLGVSHQASDLDAFIDSLGERGVRPDLILFTGDLADDFSQIVPALRAADRLKPKFGIHSSLGNHEYLHGVAEARRQYDRGRANLLVERGLPITVGSSRLYLAGTDDPLSVSSDIGDFMRRTVERSMLDKPRDAFSILLSHRPEGFAHAANAGIDLTLSGHTHGGQIGFNGKSAFEPLYPDGYLWGLYKKNESTLYTTSGWGNWFPFRLGCPAEAPLIILKRAA